MRRQKRALGFEWSNVACGVIKAVEGLVFCSTIVWEWDAVFCCPRISSCCPRISEPPRMRRRESIHTYILSSDPTKLRTIEGGITIRHGDKVYGEGTTTKSDQTGEGACAMTNVSKHELQCRSRDPSHPQTSKHLGQQNSLNSSRRGGLRQRTVVSIRYSCNCCSESC